MAYSKSFASPEEQYGFKIIDYFFAVNNIIDGEDKLRAAISGEAFLWPYLEGSAYLASKEALYKSLDDEKKDFILPDLKLLIANIKGGLSDAESEKQILSIIENYSKVRRRSLLQVADAILKLQQRAVKEGGVYGKKGISVVTPRGTKEQTEKILNELSEDLEDVA